MAARSEECSSKDHPNNVPPTAPPTPVRTDNKILADELSKTADMINWPRVPEFKKFEAMADQMHLASYYGADELIDTSAYEREQLCEVLS